MLMELVMELVVTVDAKERERTYRKIEKLGVDRATADLMASEFHKEAV